MKLLGNSSFLAVVLLIIGCSDDRFEKQPTNSKTLFTLLSNEKTGIDFKNSIDQDLSFNALNYPYAYNGGGVSVGDVNNDGLQDIYFVSNQHSNKLYINTGNFEFEDVADLAGVSDVGGWSTGTTMIDINNDGWLDIYICKSSFYHQNVNRHNKLYVNQQNGTFKEEAAKWGLDDDGFSTQSYFFDYDKDGDLDMYLVNHRYDYANANNYEDLNARVYYSETSDHLYRNEGEFFSDVTIKSGIRNKEYGLSAAIGDFNNDNWPDIYVANDLITPDYLYINNKNGTFTNQIKKRLSHTSYTSMGSDFADINNDFLPDLLVLDMSAEDHRRGKENMPSMDTDAFWQLVDGGYHYAYMSNILNLNLGNGFFTDIAQVSGISKTDWSWAPLIADYDNDGYKDIFITNGLEHELGNQDYRQKLNAKQAASPLLTIEEILNTMPSEKLQNYAFRNNGDLTFSKVAIEWGLDKMLNSNGVAYGDLDNDGDLDLVLNNLEDQAIVYRNNSTGNYINIKFIGDAKNVNAIGTRVKIYTDKTRQYQELYLSRGFLSSVTNVLNFGLGDEKMINRIEVIWGSGKVLAAENVEANQTLTFDQKDFKFDGEKKSSTPTYFSSIDPKSKGINFLHRENDFNDFGRQVLLPQKQSQKGPALSVADVNSDGRDDFYIGGALGQSGELYLQEKSGKFIKSSNLTFEKDRAYEDYTAFFFDVDSDKDLDLYVTSGGYELGESSLLLQDRLYLNDGLGNFSRGVGLPEMIGSSHGVCATDYDGDGDMDVVVGGHVIPGKYPLSAETYFLKNTEGRFENVTQLVAPGLSEIGIVNDLIFSDYDGDGDKDLIVVGEWFPITFFNNERGVFTKIKLESLTGTEGWWNTIKEIDWDKDGDMDYLIGNLGQNNKFHPSKEKPLHIYSSNFDSDGNYDMILSKVYNGDLVPIRGKECSTEQNPFVSEKIRTYKEYANSTLLDIYGKKELEGAYHKVVHNFSSIYLENADGSFVVRELPTVAQLGPTMAFVETDINGDGHIDILGIGAIHEAEVETVRYDGNTGYILLGDSKGNFEPFLDHRFFTTSNSKNMEKITIAGDKYFIVANNNGSLELFSIDKRIN